jgi:hypothetical protein
MIFREFIKKEMIKLQSNSFYYGSKEQIKAEKFILENSKIKMEFRECIEEYYYRILKTLSR